MKESQKLKSPPQTRFKFGKAYLALIIIICLALGLILGYFLKGDEEVSTSEPAFEREVVVNDGVKMYLIRRDKNVVALLE
ncbi:MAG: hypothetical protein H5T74_10920 [Actinobacteria bacterium]|nr:hypothetical protein [Actinomycetota bacterium]